MFIGHSRLREDLETNGLPVPPALFSGPASVGKWQLAEHARRFHGILDSDVLRVKMLTMDNARMMRVFGESRPVGKIRLVIARMDKASSNAHNVLLKTLEETPDTTRFILITESEFPATVRSRGFLYRFGLLSEKEVAEILIKAKGFAPEIAAARAALSRGQVSRALEVQNVKLLKHDVVSLMATFEHRDARLLESFAQTWTDEHTELLTVWCNEAVTGRWAVFSEDDVVLPSRSLPLKILIALNAEIRPRLVVRSSLLNVMRGLS